MKTFVKLSGLATADAVALVPAGGAAGFVVDVPGAPASIGLADVPPLLDRLDRDAEAWAIVRDPTAETVHRLFDDAGVDRVQVYGKIPDGLEFLEIHHLVPSLPVPVRGTDGPDPPIPPAEDYSRLHVDAAGDPLADGSARVADPACVGRIIEGQPGRKIVLAGGLTAATVGPVLAESRPWGIDVSAGVRDPAGRIDPGRVRAFLDAVAAAEAPPGG